MRDNGGHLVALKWSMKNVYDVDPGEVWWSASDVGWVVGHSYIVYAPLFHGATTILFEGKPAGTPDKFAKMRIEFRRSAREVQGFYTTAFNQGKYLFHGVFAHQLGAIGARVDMAVYTAEITQITQVDLQSLQLSSGDGREIGGQ